MQNLGTPQLTGLNLELFHVQSSTSFAIPTNSAVIRIGKPNEKINPDIDVSALPDADIVSRLHAEIQIEGNNYYIEDLGSSNGTYLNNTKLEPGTRYALNLGDKINLAQEEKVTFIFQNRQQNQTNNIYISNPTVFQPQNTNINQKHKVDRTSKLLGSALMIAGIIIFASSTQIGIFVRLPGVLLCVVGVAILIWGRINPIFGLLLILGGIGFIVFTGGVFASVNFLAFLISSALLAVGYLLFSTGKVGKYDLQTIKDLIKQKGK
ncbi:phosphopeptide-binding protein [Fischerella thermalis CCMEE 5268]|uniref:Phosphopeptide-binding protein n=1 Tax=Fischerella thermalis CCMEE 5268 TaxID=2019662 RepID=A0A2N6KG41_9CYAN|nr:FHA domain-containing protein [Fischerella thermalis]PLZ98197.1 phosphopeptide-binding protein [Fischerella thermalis CCMEE 5268]